MIMAKEAIALKNDIEFSSIVFQNYSLIFMFIQLVCFTAISM